MPRVIVGSRCGWVCACGRVDVWGGRHRAQDGLRWEEDQLVMVDVHVNHMKPANQMRLVSGVGVLDLTS